MKTSNDKRLNPCPICSRLLTILAIMVSFTTSYAQDSANSSDKATPELSETTLKILEAHAQASLQSPVSKTPEESQLTGKKPRKMETGGLLKEWFAPFERKKKEEDQTADSKKAGTPLWKWFDPTAPLTEAELKAKPIDWKGRRTLPQSFGSPQKTDPEGLKLFFIRYK